MSEQHLQYNPSQCISCENCLIYCPIGCISLAPLTITPDCIECEQCIDNCPKREKVLRIAYNDELGGDWISPFGYRAESKGESSETTPSNPSEQESSQNPSKEPSKEDSSSTEEKDEGNSSQESQGESKGESSFTPADKAKLEALKNAFLSAPPPPTKYNQAQRS